MTVKAIRKKQRCIFFEFREGRQAIRTRRRGVALGDWVSVLLAYSLEHVVKFRQFLAPAKDSAIDDVSAIIF